MSVHVRNVVATMTVVDAEALLSPVLLERIVRAAAKAQEAQRADERSRVKDTKIGDCGCHAHEGEGL
jgi:hypothetical protein